MSKVEIIVKVDKAYGEKLADVAAQCEAAGMNVEQRMNAVRMISGSIEKTSIKKIEKIKGVSYVEESKSIGI